MAVYTSKYSAQNTKHTDKYIGSQARFGIAKFGIARFGQAKTAYTSKYSSQNNSYTSKY